MSIRKHNYKYFISFNGKMENGSDMRGNITLNVKKPIQNGKSIIELTKYIKTKIGMKSTVIYNYLLM